MKITKRNEPLPCGCGGGSECEKPAVKIATLGELKEAWSDGVVSTSIGEIPRVRTKLNAADRWGAIKARWGSFRMDYSIQPGLYAVGNPVAESPVLVSANYKLSFDHLRKKLSGLNAWILVLDTKGINVWCAAGKGTFGTNEIIKRVQCSGLDQIVAHRKLILPQLGAPGVSAHLVQDGCGFRVLFGPVRAEDLPAYLEAGMKATSQMRRVRFSLWDRVVLIPVELVMGAKYAFIAAAALLLLGGINSHGYSLDQVRTTGFVSAALVLSAYLCGVVLGPALLPWLPGRAFSSKGAMLGLIAFGGIFLWFGPLSGTTNPVLHVLSWLLMAPAFISFIVMNFTGASTYTSLSGVLREMKLALPVQIGGAAVGLVLWGIGLFLPGGQAV